MVCFIFQSGSLFCAILFMWELWFQTSNAIALVVIVYLVCATISGILLLGVVKSRPTYLIPFFWFQLFDFFFSLLSFLSSHNTRQSHSPLIGKFSSIVTWNSLIPTCIIFFKGYFLCVVWKCYRYLKIQGMVLPIQCNLVMAPPDTITKRPTTESVARTNRYERVALKSVTISKSEILFNIGNDEVPSYREAVPDEIGPGRLL